MANTGIHSYDPWPALSAEEFKKTAYLLHMCTQIVGKLMLNQPFEPHWANLAMPLTSRGMTTGVIPYHSGTFSVDFDFIDHMIILISSWGKMEKVSLASQSVSALYDKIFKALSHLGVDISINKKPQEVSNPIDFDKDSAPRIYDGKIVNSWWRIMVSTNCVLLKFHSRFYGITPRIGVLWGTLDLRDARYKGEHLQATQETSNYIARNAMDDSQFEVGWSASNEKYSIPSFFAFAYPKPAGYESAHVKPDHTKWIPAINEFVLNYDDLRKSKDPHAELLLFFETTYQAMANMAKWDPTLIVSGKPI